jgi:hypothetical protein
MKRTNLCLSRITALIDVEATCADRVCVVN